MYNVETVLEHYVIAALWSSTDNSDDSGGYPLDENYGPEDIAAGTMLQMREDVAAFLDEVTPMIAASGQTITDEMLGHDFWLTRNRHGAGFWDRGLGELGQKLTDACRPYGSCDLYICDDGMIYSI